MTFYQVTIYSALKIPFWNTNEKLRRAAAIINGYNPNNLKRMNKKRMPLREQSVYGIEIAQSFFLLESLHRRLNSQSKLGKP